MKYYKRYAVLFLQALSQACEAPLALTSANTSGASSTLSVQEFKELWPKLSAVYDGGVLGKIHTYFSRFSGNFFDE